ncbi:hypothetical protein [Paralimibaculum aggregatum]|nr:hypothetical protein [Limibaculum sp. NKW23]
MNFGFSPPKIPIQMQAALAAGMGNSTRLDMAISAWMGSVTLPSLTMSAGPLLQMNLALGMFDLFDLPKLKLQLEMAITSFAKHVWPHLSFLARINLKAVLQLAAIARLQLALDGLKINLAATLGSGAPTSISARAKFALTPPQIKMGQMLLALPIALKFQETLGSFGHMKSHFSAMAKMQLALPKFAISIPLMMKLALALEAIATIKAAFGADAMTPAGLSRIAARLRLYMGLPLPSPLPPLALAAKLPALPTLDSLKIAASSGPSSFRLQLPSIPIMAQINAMMAIKATLPIEIPINACGAGACPLGGT